MWKLSELKECTDKKHKYTVELINKDTNKTKTIHFGAYGMSDYTEHKDKERKQRYLERHEKNEDWSNPLTAGFWSRWLLWNLPTKTQSLNYILKHFKL